MNKVVVGLFSMMVSLSANAADFTVELVPAPGSVQFSDVANKPATFPPSTHAHAISDVTNLQSELNSKVSAASVVDQAGSIMAFAGPCPAGTLITDGASLSRGTYAKLFNRIGTAHGSEDPSSFNIPDYRGRFLRMTDGGANRDTQRASRLAMKPDGTTGDTVGSVRDDENKEHNHTNLGSGSAQFLYVRGAGGYFQSLSESGGNIDRTTQPIAPSGGPESRPKNANVNYCIVF